MTSEFRTFQFVSSKDSRRIHNEAITKVIFVPEKAMLISASKDKTLKFWRFKQLKVVDVQPKIKVDGKDALDLGLGSLSKAITGKPLSKQRSGYDRNDPLMGEEEDVSQGDSYGRFARGSFERNSSGHQPKPTAPSDKQPKKKDDSDDDLAGWDT